MKRPGSCETSRLTTSSFPVIFRLKCASDLEIVLEELFRVDSVHESLGRGKLNGDLEEMRVLRLLEGS